MEPDDTPKWLTVLEKVVGFVTCKVLRDHSWSWSLIDGERISLSGPVPDRAVCKHCGITKGETK